MIKIALNDSTIKKCLIIDRNSFFGIPQDMEEFTELLAKDDWNEFLYSQILKSDFNH